MAMNFKRFIFISALLLTVVLPLGAQTMLFSLTNQVWRYNQSNIDLGTVWKDVNYDDSGWPSGLGVFEGKNGTVPASIAAVKHTTLLLTNIGRTNQTITYYFRTQFAFTNDPSTVYLVATNLVDDGAIFISMDWKCNGLA